MIRRCPPGLRRLVTVDQLQRLKISNAATAMTMIPQYSHYHRNHQQPQRRSLAISASERPQRFYWTVDVTSTAAPAEAMKGDRIDGDESDDGRRRRQQSRLAVRPPPASLLHSSSSSSSSNDHVNVDDNINHVTQWYTVTLDGRPVKTPSGTLLAVPSQSWGYGIAAEWDSVTSRTGVQPSNMPLMTLACTALDRTVQYDECLRFLQTDTVLYWADPHDDRSLYKRQQRAWRDLHAWMNTTFIGRASTAGGAGASTNGEMAAGTAAAAADSTSTTPLLFPPFATASAREALRGLHRRGLPHDPRLTSACRDYLTHRLDVWHGTLLQSAVRETKSFVTGAALVSRAITASAAQTAARVEEEVQIDHWGLVEGQHDYDRLNGSVALHAVSFVAHCLQHDVLLPAKAAQDK